MNHQNCIFLAFLLLFSIYQVSSLKESKSSDEYINSSEEFQELIDSPEFEDYIVEKELDEINLKGLFGGGECLMSKNEAVKVLKDSYGVSNSNPDENLRFILGKCNPVLLVPGIYATKFVVELECKNIATEEKTTTLKNLRVFCGDTLCQDETKVREEHALFMGVFDKAFTIVGTENDKYSSCLGFIMNYFQNPNECPKVNSKNICYYSKYIKVGYYGCSTDTLKDSRCGVEGVQNVIQTGILTVDNIINFGPARSYYGISKNLISRGYKEGFSLGSIPYDFRRFIATNEFATKVFRFQIENIILQEKK